LLEARNLADVRPLQSPAEARRWGYQFDSYRQRYQQLFTVVREQLEVPQSNFVDWLKLSADQRQPWLQDADLKTSAALLILEQAALRQQVQHIQQDLKLRFMTEGHEQDALNEAGQLMQELLRDSGFLSRPADLLPQGYGLPQPTDQAWLQQAIGERQAGLLEMTERLDKRVIGLLFPEQQRELDGISGNLALLRERLRQQHQDGGGLSL